MPELDHAEASRPSEDVDGIRVLELPTVGGTARITLPPTADAPETAAIAAAIHAHLDDEGQQASDERANRWKLAGRLGIRSPGRVPNCRCGDEWKTAARPY